MRMRLDPMGTLTVHTDSSWNFADGPLGGRSCTSFREVTWESDHLTARSVWANGSYRNGPEIAEPNIRIMFRTDDDVLLYLDYVARVHLPTNVTGASPSILTGRIEVDDGNTSYAWLNRTAVVGHGVLDLNAGTMTYEMGVLRWDGDGRSDR